VCIPTFNEVGTIGELIRGIEDINRMSKLIVVIDDGSDDGTREIVEKSMVEFGNILLVEREGKRGLGSAILEGFNTALSVSPPPDYIVTMDGDLSHDPGELRGLVGRCGEDVLAVGSRYVSGGCVEGWSLWRVLVSKTANFLARYMGGISVSDATSGFRCYGVGVVKGIMGDLRCQGYDFQLETLMEAYRKGFRVVEHPISFVDRRHGESKLGLGECLRFTSLVVSRSRLLHLLND
jgi:dolichol-phosphate mannosyltransferase